MSEIKKDVKTDKKSRSFNWGKAYDWCLGIVSLIILGGLAFLEIQRLVTYNQYVSYAIAFVVVWFFMSGIIKLVRR